MWRARQYFTNAGYETTTRRPSRRCSRVRRPRFQYLAPRPHPSTAGYERLDSNPVPSPTGCGARANISQTPDTKPPRGGQAAAVAGYAGPGFHNWPLGHIPQDPDTKALIRIRRVPTGLKTRSARRSARRSVIRSAPRPGSATPATKNPDTKPPRGGKAAAVAGYAGPGFHTWPLGHILQDTDTNALIRIRSPAPPDVARTPIFHKRRIRNHHAAAKPPL